MVPAAWSPTLSVGTCATISVVIGALLSLKEYKGWKGWFLATVFIVLGIGEIAAILKADGDHVAEVSDLRNKLEEIQKNTQKHATISIRGKEGNLALPEPVSTKHPLRVNFSYLNLGNEATKNYRVFSHVYVISANPIIRSTVEDVWQLFSRWKDDTDRLHGYGSELALGVPYWSTNEDAQVLTKSQVNDIVSGQAFIFVAIYIPFQDDLGSHVQDKCFWIQPPATSMSPWHECGEHNTQVDFGK